MRKEMKAKPIAEVLEGLIPKLRPKRGVGQQKLWEAWRYAVGKEIASHTRVNILKNGCLHIEVESPTLLQELTGMNKTGIVAAMREKLEGVFLTDIKLKLAKD